MANGDGDPYNQLLEYVFAGDPGDVSSPAGAILRATGDGGQELFFTGPAELPDVALSLFGSPDLGAGAWVDRGRDPTVEALGGGGSSYRFELPIAPGAGEEFFRIGASLITPPDP